jgi:hypothetical protein
MSSQKYLPVTMAVILTFCVTACCYTFSRSVWLFSTKPKQETKKTRKKTATMYLVGGFTACCCVLCIALGYYLYKRWNSTSTSYYVPPPALGMSSSLSSGTNIDSAFDKLRNGYMYNKLESNLSSPDWNDGLRKI